MNSRHLLLSITATLSLFCGFGLAEAGTCDGSDKRIAYRILNENITERDSKRRIFLQVYLDPKRFTVHSMINLAAQIKCDYKEFDSIAVSIFDNKRGETLPDPPPHPLFELPSQNPPRGFFEFQRQSHTAELTFQEKRNKQVLDIEITFRPDGYCVSETPSRPGERD